MRRNRLKDRVSSMKEKEPLIIMKKIVELEMPLEEGEGEEGLGLGTVSYIGKIKEKKEVISL